MLNKIKVQIYGSKEEIIKKGCSTGGCTSGGCSSHESKGCSGCSEKKGLCGSNSPKSVIEVYDELLSYISKSDVVEKTVIEFIDISVNKINVSEEVLDVIERGFTPPITVIDGIVRFYGGISDKLIYNDIKELLEYYHERQSE